MRSTCSGVKLLGLTSRRLVELFSHKIFDTARLSKDRLEYRSLSIHSFIYPTKKILTLTKNHNFVQCINSKNDNKKPSLSYLFNNLFLVAFDFYQSTYGIQLVLKPCFESNKSCICSQSHC